MIKESKKSKKAETNILLIGVILVALVTVGTFVYTLVYKPAQTIDAYSFGSSELSGEEKVLLGEPDTEAPVQIESPVISITGLTIGIDKNGEIMPKNEFKTGETIAIGSEVIDFSQPLYDGKHAYAMEQWVATQDEYNEYVSELTAMTANFSKYADEPIDSLTFTNKLNSSYLSPGKYTIKVFVVDRFTQDLDVVEEQVTII